MKKLIFSLMVPLAFGVFGQNQKSDVKINKISLPAGWVASMSDNGKYATWTPMDYEEPDALVSIVDVEKGEIVNLPVTDPDQLEPGMRARMKDITNDGLTVVGMYASQPAYYTKANEKWTKLRLPSKYRKWDGEVTSCSADGAVLVGWVNQNWNRWNSVMWKRNAEGGYDLYEPKLPTYQDMYDDGIITLDILESLVDDEGNLPTPYYSMHGVTGDGKYILCSFNRNQEVGGNFLFNLENNTWEWVDRGYGDFVMSNNGRYFYIGGSAGQGETGGRAYVYDRETGTKTSAPTSGSIVDNFGNVYCEVGYDMNRGIRGDLCVEKEGILVDLASVLKQKFEYDWEKEIGTDPTGWPVAISDDGHTVIAMNAMRVRATSITLPGIFADNFNGVNVLKNYEVGPKAGLPLAKLQFAAIQFKRDCMLDPDKQATIECDGVPVAVSTEIKYGNSSSQRLFSIEFPVTSFEVGKTYDVVIPEGTFYLQGTNFKSDEIRWSYIGREDGPVQYTAISPKDGSAIADFSQSNSISIQFNTDIRVGNPAEYPGIYEKGAKDPLSRLTPSVVDDRRLVLYPAAAVYLPQGLEYEVRIPANTVTDPALFCGNEPITLSYKGAYIRETKGYFFEDFNQPNAALRSFIQYEGDHNEPVDEMVPFGFDSDNTPWNFSIRDNGEFDYAAASHSQYKNKGQSDDWMVIPQIALKGKSGFLSFKGQSYDPAKKDILKIYIWENDNMYNSLSKAVVDRIKKEATLVFEEQLLPGASKDKLAGEWKEYTVPLADYADKNIYICFVNENQNQSMLILDDILVDSNGNFTVSTGMNNNLVNADDMEVTAMITPKSDKSGSAIKGKCTNSTNGESVNFEGTVTAATGERVNITFPERIKLEKGAINRLEIEFEMDGDVMGMSHQVKNLTKEMTRKVLIEEGTGAWCGNCPMGVVAFEKIEEAHPGQLVPVAVHNEDSYAYPAYDSYIAVGGYPMGRVNRDARIVSPMNNMELTSASSDQTWYDLFLKELAEPVECEIRVVNPTYSTSISKMQAEVEVEFALSRDNAYYNVFTVVLEDNLPISQHNYFAADGWSSATIMGEWLSTGSLGSQGEYARTYADHVARGIAGSNFGGEGGYVPEKVTAGEVYRGVLTFDRPTLREAEPALGESYKNVSFAVALIDITTGRVVNADIIKGVKVVDTVGVDDINGDVANSVVFTVNGGVVYANGSADGVEVYNIQGQRVANEGLNGLYIVRNGSKVEKLLVR